MAKKLSGAKGSKEIKLPDKLAEILPTTREAAVARLHFHFPKKLDYDEAVVLFDTYTLNDNIGQAYYRTIAKKGK
jgi:hypothetical protein